LSVEVLGHGGSIIKTGIESVHDVEDILGFDCGPLGFHVVEEICDGYKWLQDVVLFEVGDELRGDCSCKVKDTGLFKVTFVLPKVEGLFPDGFVF